MNTTVAIGLVLFCSVIAFGAGILPPQQADVQKVFNDLYGAEFQKVVASKDAVGSVALAGKLFAAAGKAESIAGFQDLLYEKVVQLGIVDPRGYEKALSAIEILTFKSPDKESAFLEALLKIRKYQYEATLVFGKAKAAKTYADCLISDAVAKALRGETVEARKQSALAQRLARENRLTDTEFLDNQVKCFEEIQKNLVKASQLEAALKANPSDITSRDSLVRLFLVDLDNPSAALKHLDKGLEDEKIRKYLPLVADGKESISEAAHLEIGHWYCELAGQAGLFGKTAMLKRAKAHYEIFLRTTRNAQLRTVAQLALDSVNGNLGKAANVIKSDAPDKAQWIDLLKPIDVSQHVVLGTCEKTDEGIYLKGDWRRLVVSPVAAYGNYDIEVVFVNKNSEGRMCLLLPIKNTAVNLWVGSGNKFQGSDFGLEMVNGKENTKITAERLASNKPYTFLVQVRTKGDSVSIISSLDGKLLIQWAGPITALSLNSHWKGLPPKHFGLGSYCLNVYITKAQIQLLTDNTGSSR